METLSLLIMSWRDIRNPASGGAEVFTHEVAKRWVNWGHEVTLLTSRFGEGPEEESIDGVEVVRQGTPLTVYRRVKKAYLDRFHKSSDVVVDQINTRPFLSPRYLKEGTPVIALIFQLAREYWFYETRFPLNVLGRYWLENRWLRLYHGIPTFTISKSTRDDLLSLGFRKVTVLPVGAPVNPLQTVPEKESVPTVIYLSRFKKAKLPGHAIKAFERLRKDLPQAKLWMVGDGYLRRKLERLSPPGVVFFGKVSESKKIELLKRAHVLLFPAVREGWGLTITEANALGTPAVGYDVSGLRDSIKDDETGRLVDFGDVKGLAESTAELLVDASLRQRLSEAALAWAGGFSWDRSAESLLAGLRESILNIREVGGQDAY